MESKRRLFVLAILEIVLMALAVLFDFLLPTIVVSTIGALFIFVRKEKFANIGFKRQQHFPKMLLGTFGLAIGWTFVNFGFILPILNHLTGTTRDVSAFANLKGDISELLFLLAISWILAAIGEELAYRGFMQNRIIGLFSNRATGIVVAVLVSSFLFSLAHTEHGLIGVVTTYIDALFFSYIRYKYDNLWASILVHGFLNAIGIITFFFTGPLYGLW